MRGWAYGCCVIERQGIVGLGERTIVILVNISHKYNDVILGC